MRIQFNLQKMIWTLFTLLVTNLILYIGMIIWSIITPEIKPEIYFWQIIVLSLYFVVLSITLVLVKKQRNLYNEKLEETIKQLWQGYMKT